MARTRKVDMSNTIIEQARMGKADHVVRLALRNESLSLEDALRKIAAGHATPTSAAPWITNQWTKSLKN